MRRPSQISSSTIWRHPVSGFLSDMGTTRGAPAMIAPVGSPYTAAFDVFLMHFSASVLLPLVLSWIPPRHPAPLYGKCTGRRNMHATAHALARFLGAPLLRCSGAGSG